MHPRHCYRSILFVVLFISIIFTGNGQTQTAQFQYTPIQNLDVSANTTWKPQSKVWKYAGKWWAVMPDQNGTKLWRLDGDSWTEMLLLASNDDTHADAKVAGDVTHVLLFKGVNSKLVSLEYNPATGNYQFWSQRPEVVHITLDTGVLTATIDMDRQGRMWLASDGVSDLNVRWSDPPYTNWNGPILLGTGIGNSGDKNDIGVVVAFDGKIGVMWSNGLRQRFGFKYHIDGDDPSVWSADENPGAQTAQNVGDGFADDHLNVAVGSDGTLYAIVKTGYDVDYLSTLLLMVRRPNGTWDAPYTVEMDETATRPIVLLNEAEQKLLAVFKMQGSGIFFKTSDLYPISFGLRKNFLSDSDLNDPTSTKQNFTDEVVVLTGTGSKASGIIGHFGETIPTIKWVDQQNGSNINDGNSEATAYASLQYAIDNTNSGTAFQRSIIYVKTGTYGVDGLVNENSEKTAILIDGLDYLSILAVDGHNPLIRPPVGGNVVSLSVQNSNNLIIDNIDSDQDNNQFIHWQVFSANNLVVRNSSFVGGGEGILFENTLKTALIEKNTFQNINLREFGNSLGLNNAHSSDVVIQDNLFINDSRPLHIQPPGEFVSSNILVRRNYFQSTNFQEHIRLKNVSGVTIENNLITNSAQQGLFIDYNCSEIDVWQNTFFGNTMEQIRCEQTRDDFQIQNNILYGQGTYAAIAANSPQLPGEDFNLIFNDGTQLQNTGMIRLSNFGSHDFIEIDPLFVNDSPGSPDLHLQENSPAIAAGTNLNVSDDFEQNARPLPAGTLPDLGALEKNQGGGVAVPDISVMPKTHNYGNVLLGYSASQSLVIKNNGMADLTVSTTELNGPDAGDFTIEGSQVPFTLAPVEESEIVITFTPQTIGVKMATLSIESNDPDENPLEVTLTGTGVEVNSNDFVFTADEDIVIDRPVLSEGNVHSNRNIVFEEGLPSIHTGNLEAVKDITIKKDNRIVGNALAGGKIDLKGNAEVTGAVQPNADVQKISLPDLSFQAGGKNFKIGGGKTLAIRPGFYGDVTTGKKAVIILEHGQSTNQEWTYAIFSGEDIKFKSSGTVNGNVYGEKDVQNDGGVTINGEVETSKFKSLPEVDWTFFKEQARAAGQYVKKDKTFRNNTYTGVWYVGGNANIQDNAIIYGTIVTSGDIEIISKINPNTAGDMEGVFNIQANPENYPVLLSKKNIKFSSSLMSIKGLVFAGHDMVFDEDQVVSGILIAGHNVQTNSLIQFDFNAAYVNDVVGVTLDPNGQNTANGEYFFKKLKLDDRSKLVVDVSEGPVTINVKDEIKFDYGTEVQTIPYGENGTSFVTFNVLQSSRITFNHVLLLGEFNAPLAEVMLKSKTLFKGALSARKIQAIKKTKFLPHTSQTSLPRQEFEEDKPEIELENGQFVTISDYQLSQNYPNPFNPTTIIAFMVPEAGPVSIRIFNVNGQSVTTLASGNFSAGQYEFSWDGTNSFGQPVASGIYFYVMQAGSFHQVKKMMLVR